jgi:thiosulfate/3-mercaptopyruvate sulfurtransferase
MESLVTTAWLAKEMGASDLRIVDATKFLDPARDPRADYESGHIPGAVFMDLADLTDTNSTIENMVPPAEKFASRMQSLGLGDGSRIVIYDNSPLKSAARAWWMLSQVFGAHGVAILDGGLAKWIAEDRPLETGTKTLRHRHFTVWKDQKAIRTKGQMLANVENGSEDVVDARPAARFTGDDPEPRPGMASGHIPGSKNLPHSMLFNADGTWKQGDALTAAFADAGVDLTKPLVATCGSGMTASALLFGAHLLGKADIALYDGSWSEWGADPDTPKATGPA